MIHKKINNQQLAILALRTGQWLNAVFIQGRRFLDALEKKGGTLPWEEEDTSSLFIADRLFFITALHHVIGNLEDLNNQMLMRDNSSLQPLLDAIATEAERKKIRMLRNMNEHDLAYLAEEGRKQNHFSELVELPFMKIQTNAFVTYVDGNQKAFLIGGIDIQKLLFNLKSVRADIQKEIEKIFNQNEGI